MGVKLHMRYLAILILVVSFSSLSKTITISPILPIGFSFFEEYEPDNEINKSAFVAVVNYLKSNNDAVWNYYLSSSKLNVATSEYEFKVKHSSVYTKNPYAKPYLNGTFIYNVKDKSVRFVRELQLNKSLKQDK